MKGVPDPEVEKIVRTVWKNLGVSQTSATQDEIIQSLYYPVINEAFKCLEEGVALRPLDIDMCLVFGYNWPRATGGPMYYAASVGLPAVHTALEKMGVKQANLLKECVQNGWNFESEGFKQRLAGIRAKL